MFVVVWFFKKYIASILSVTFISIYLLPKWGLVFSQCLLKTSYLIAILTRNRKNSSRMSKTIKLTQRQRSEPAQRYLAFTLIPFTFTLIFSHLHFTGTLHICVMAVMPCHGLYHHRSTEGCVTSPRRHRLFWEWQTIILLSTAIWVVFFPSSLLKFSWLLTMTSLSPLMMHLIRLSDPCCQQTHEPLSRARGRVLVKRGNCNQSRSEEWRTAWSRFLMTLLKVKFKQSLDCWTQLNGPQSE
mgnify:CR=1 FL=1